ncbi:MAG: head GIN domain-containing protein [Bacteroidota bacterium]
MKQSFLSLTVFLAFGILVLSGCVDDSDWCLRADGPIVTETLNLAEFNSIALHMSARVELTQGEVQEVIFEGREDILDRLELNVRNGVWDIDYDGCLRDVDSPTLFITVPELEDVRVTGSGEIYSTNTFLVPEIDLSITGAGRIDMAVEVSELDADISGSGEIFVEGSTLELDVRISGSGDFRGFDCPTLTSDLRISGSGRIRTYTENELDALISGSGDILFKGNPELFVSISGSGEVIDAN